MTNSEETYDVSWDEDGTAKEFISFFASFNIYLLDFYYGPAL